MRKRIIFLHTSGHKGAHIAQMMGRPALTIKSIIKKYNDTGEVHASRKGGVLMSNLTAEEKE